METIYIKLLDSSEQIPFVLTYGVHKELQEYLMSSENRLFGIFNDTEISDEVIRLCLSERNSMGLIITEFVEIQLVMADDMILLLNLIFDYFSDFFLKHTKKVQSLTNSLSQN